VVNGGRSVRGQHLQQQQGDGSRPPQTARRASHTHDGGVPHWMPLAEYNSDNEEETRESHLGGVKAPIGGDDIGWRS